MDGYGTLISALLLGGASMLTAIGGLIVQVRRGDPETKARMTAAETEVGNLRTKLLSAEAVIFRLKSILVREGLMSMAELEHGEDGPQ